MTTFEYQKWDVWHPDFPEHKLFRLEAMDKRGAGLKGLIPHNADKRMMMSQESY
jgi:hypothetical protein